MFNIFNRYVGHPEAVIISCFYNPTNSEYRLKVFNQFYKTIKHLNHEIIECIIGNGERQLPENPNIYTIQTENLLWHKEAILNKIIRGLPKKYKYVFWVDADVIFTNKRWLVESVEQLQTVNILQPFEYCVHLEKDQTRPNSDLQIYKNLVNQSGRLQPVWRSFAANYVTTTLSDNVNYDIHGHVGFAWGARREILDEIPLYDKALIGGADHIMAHAAAGQIPHKCITKSFSDDIDNVLRWSREYFKVVKGKIGYVKGDLWHNWHGKIEDRDYLKRIRDFTPKTRNLSEKDSNGLYVTKKPDDPYIKNYFKQRETSAPVRTQNIQVQRDDGFIPSAIWGYITDNPMLGWMFGGNFWGGWMGSSIRDSVNSSESHKDHIAPSLQGYNSEPLRTNEIHGRATDGLDLNSTNSAPVLEQQILQVDQQSDNFS